MSASIHAVYFVGCLVRGGGSVFLSVPFPDPGTSSSMSSTASRELPFLSSFSSAFSLLSSWIPFLVSGLPGRDIRSIQGSHWRKMMVIQGGLEYQHCSWGVTLL